VSGVRAAAVQPPSFIGADDHKNAEQAVRFIDEGADQGAAYVVFPDVPWSRPDQSHDRRPELNGELTKPQPDAFAHHYERRGLDTLPREDEKIRGS
jgi:predicted amidohydrolase